MEVSITQPLGFSQLGSRANNEDTLFPDPQTTDPQQRWFLVCDGVGGSEKGEVASQLAATEFDRYFRKHPVRVVTDAYIHQALTYVQDRFDDYVAANPQAESMGTTMTLIYRHDEGITVAHLGDSRVYLVRDGAVEWRTDDHSYVNELVKAGVLNPEEARKHPQRNVITRAIQGGQKRAEADVQLLNDLQPGDYLFMCTDGILERISDELLEKTLGGPESNEEKLRTLLACSYGHTRDNFTAYLIQVAEVTGSVASSARVKLPSYARPESDDDDYSVTLIGVPRPEPLPSYATLNDGPQPQDEIPAEREPALPVAQKRFSLEVRPTMPPVSSIRPRQKNRRWIPWVLVALLLGIGCFALWYRFFGPMQERQSNTDRPVKEVTNTLAPAPETASVVGGGSNKTESATTADSTGKVLSDLPVTGSIKDTTNTKSAGKSGEVVEAALRAKPVDKDGLISVYRYTNAYWDLEVVKDANGKRGLINKGALTFQPQFDSIRLEKVENGLIPATLNGKKKFISLNKKIYDERGKPSCGRIWVRKDTQCGFVNMIGQEVPGKFVKAESFDLKNNCTAKVTEPGGDSYRINTDGKKIMSTIKSSKSTK